MSRVTGEKFTCRRCGFVWFGENSCEHDCLSRVVEQRDALQRELDALGEKLRTLARLMHRANPSAVWDLARMYYTSDHDPRNTITEWHRGICEEVFAALYSIDYATPTAQCAPMTTTTKTAPRTQHPSDALEAIFNRLGFVHCNQLANYLIGWIKSEARRKAEVEDSLYAFLLSLKALDHGASEQIKAAARDIVEEVRL